MIKNKKAQIMALDVLFSVVLIILIFFLLFNVVEARINQANTDRINREFDSIGNLVFMNIINNPLINCYAKDTQNKYHIPACLGSNDSNITKQTIGLPDGYKCNLSGLGGGFVNNECVDAFDPATDYFYSIDFNVSIISDREISKFDYTRSYKGSATNLDNIAQLNLKVWKDE
jgi:hypothetical protein